MTEARPDTLSPAAVLQEGGAMNVLSEESKPSEDVTLPPLNLNKEDDAAEVTTSPPKSNDSPSHAMSSPPSPPRGSPLRVSTGDLVPNVILDSPHNSHLKPEPRQESAAKMKWMAAGKNVMVANKFAGVFNTLRDQSEVNEIKLEQLKTLAKLGEGAFATVEKCEYTDKNGNKRVVAVKKLKPEISTNPAEMQSFINECNLLRKLQNKYIIGYIGIGSVDTSCEKKQKETMFLVCELMQGGTLKKLVLKQMGSSHKQLFGRYDALRWSGHIAHALAYIHGAQPQVIHRDLKLENVLLQGDSPATQIAKLADFGLAAFVEKTGRTAPPVNLRKMSLSTQQMQAKQEMEGNYNKGATEIMNRLTKNSIGPGQMMTSTFPFLSKTSGAPLLRVEKAPFFKAENLPRAKSLLSGQTGSLMYMSPEMYRGDKKYTEKVDVFSFGIVMYELLHQYTVICAISTEGTEEEIEMYAYRVSEGYRPPIHDSFHPEIKKLIGECWSQRAEDRPSMKDVAARIDEMLTRDDIVTNEPMTSHCCTIC